MNTNANVKSWTSYGRNARDKSHILYFKNKFEHCSRMPFASRVSCSAALEIPSGSRLDVYTRGNVAVSRRKLAEECKLRVHYGRSHCAPFRFNPRCAIQRARPFIPDRTARAPPRRPAVALQTRVRGAVLVARKKKTYANESIDRCEGDTQRIRFNRVRICTLIEI